MTPARRIPRLRQAHRPRLLWSIGSAPWCDRIGWLAQWASSSHLTGVSRSDSARPAAAPLAQGELSYTDADWKLQQIAGL